MRQLWLFMIVGALATLTMGMLLLAGCGGSGGPITTAQTGTPAPSQTEQFIQLIAEHNPDLKNATYVGDSQCANCHTSRAEGSGKIDMEAWSHTKHAELGLGCEQCHGPASLHVSAPQNKNILTYPLISRSTVCAQCHGPKSSAYDISAHAEIVETVIARAETGPSGAKTCLRCHSAPFRLQYVDAPQAAGKTPDEIEAGIAALTDDQVKPFAKTEQSASCTNCHHPHRKTGNLTEAGKDKQLLRPIYSTDTSTVVAGVPVKTYSTTMHICASCHNMRGGSATDSALTSASRPSMHDSPQFNMLQGIGGVEGSGPTKRTTAHATVPGQCVHCHMPQGRHSFTTSFDTSCQPCHTPADADARSAIRGTIELLLYSLRTRMETWAKGKFGDTALWDYSSLLTEANKTPPSQAQVPIEVKRARHNYYFVLRDLSLGIHNSAYTRHLLNVANQNLDAIGISKAPASATQTSRATIRQFMQQDLQRARSAERNAPYL